MGSLRRDLQQLSTDIHKALEEEERLLTRLDSAPRADVWAAFRNHDTSIVQKRRSAAKSRDKAATSPEELPAKTPNKATMVMAFGEYSSDLDSSSKRARIRSGLQRQQEKIRSLLERIQQRDIVTATTRPAQTNSPRDSI